MAKNKAILSHFYDDTTTLDNLKGRYQLSNIEEVNEYYRYYDKLEYEKFLNEDILINSPLITNHLYLLDLSPVENILGRKLSKEELGEAKGDSIYLNFIENFTSIENLSKEERNKGRYLINYYFYSPFETKKEKLEIIKNMDTLILPKKYIYDLNKNEEIATGRKLNTKDKDILNLGYTEEETWKELFKPLLEKYFIREGVEQIHQYYKNIPLVDKTQDLKERHKDYKIKYKEYNFFIDILINDHINELIYNNSKLTSYKDIIEDNINSFKERLDIIKKGILGNRTELEAILNKNKTNEDEIKNNILKKENEILIKNTNIAYSVEELLKRDLIKFNNFISCDKAQNDSFNDDFLESYNYINNYKESKKNSIEYAYYLILKESHLEGIELLYNIHLKKNNAILEAINTPGTIEAYYQENSIIFFSDIIHKRNYELMEEEKELERGNYREYVNEFFNAIIYQEVSFNKLKGKRLKSYQEIVKNLNDLMLKRNLDESKLINVIDFQEEDKIRKNIENYQKEINNIYDELKKNNIFYDKDIDSENIYEIVITTPSEKSKNNLNVKITEAKEIIVETPNLTIIRPLKFSMAITKNNKTEKETKYLTSLNSNLTTALQVLKREIIKEASRKYNNGIIIFNTTKLLNKLEYSNSNLKRGRQELKFLLAILKREIISKVVLRGKVNKNGEKDYTFSEMSFISDWAVNIDTTTITLGPLYKEVISINTSKFFENGEIVHSTMLENLISRDINNCLNMGKKEATLGSLVNKISSLKQHEDSPKIQDNIYRELDKAFKGITQNGKSNIAVTPPPNMCYFNSPKYLDEKFSFKHKKKPIKLENKEKFLENQKIRNENKTQNKKKK